MKEQYFGDVNDYRKYALLRAISPPLKLGVCWMMTPPDSRNDGQKIQYLRTPETWRKFDPPLFDFLGGVIGSGMPNRINHLESSAVLGDARFFGDLFPDDGIGRLAVFSRCVKAFEGLDIVFFDPDNGIEVKSKPIGKRDSSKFVHWGEIESIFSLGASVLVYQHFTREKRADFLARLSAEFRSRLGCNALWAFQTGHAAFLLGAQSRHASIFEQVTTRTNRNWGNRFMEATRLI